MTPGEPKVALLDADYLVYSTAFASENDDVEWACRRLNEWVTDIVYMDLQCDDFKAWITGRTNFRKDIAVTQPYKGNRKDKPKPKHYEALMEYMQRLGAEVSEGEEADDCVAIEASVRGGWIVSNDKDLNQVPGWHYNPQKCIKYYVEPFEGLKNFYAQILTGDSTDGIPGLWKVGPVKAAKILDGAKTEEELCERAWEAYKDRKHNEEYFVEQGRLLWLRREPGQLWTPPIDLCTT